MLTRFRMVVHFALYFGEKGPWLEPAFKNEQYEDRKKNVKLMEELVEEFNNMLKKLSDDESNIIRYVDVRNCVSNSLEIDDQEFYGQKYEKYKFDWENELHPTERGFERIAYEFNDAIQRLILYS